MNLGKLISYGKKLGSSFVVWFGVFWLLVEPLLVFVPSFNPWKDSIIPYLILVAVALVTAAWLSRPKVTFHHRIPSIDVTIGFRQMNLFDGDNIVIGTNTTFDTQLGAIISTNSVQGQFTANVYSGNFTALDAELAPLLAPFGKFMINDPTKVFGKQERYPVGTTVCIQKVKRYYLMAFAAFDSSAPKIMPTSVDSIWASLAELWESIRSNNNLEEIVMPIIGTNFGRTNLAPEVMAKLIILSFYTSSRERRVCNKLTVALHPSSMEKFDTLQVEDFIRKLL